MKKAKFITAITLNALLLIFGIVIVVLSLQEAFYSERHELYIFLGSLICITSVYDLFRTNKKLKQLKTES